MSGLQLMETGENGVNGAVVLKHASRGSSLGHVFATRQLLSMVERNAMEKERKHKCVTTKSHVQVNINLSETIYPGNRTLIERCRVHTFISGETLDIVKIEITIVNFSSS